MKHLITATLVTTALLVAAPALAAEPNSADITANLVEPEKNSARAAATVVVTVSGVSLTDPSTANEVSKAGQAHLHYQLDGGPVVATTAPKLSFHGLTPGAHTIVVSLAANDHTPLGPQETLNVVVAQSAHPAHP